jgi:hypothetical protein
MKQSLHNLRRELRGFRQLTKAGSGLQKQKQLQLNLLNSLGRVAARWGEYDRVKFLGSVVLTQNHFSKVPITC